MILEFHKAGVLLDHLQRAHIRVCRTPIRRSYLECRKGFVIEKINLIDLEAKLQSSFADRLFKDQKKMLKSFFESFVCNLCAEKQEASTVAESEPSKPLMAVKFGSLSCVQVIHVENSRVDFNLNIDSHFLYVSNQRADTFVDQ